MHNFFWSFTSCTRKWCDGPVASVAVADLCINILICTICLKRYIFCVKYIECIIFFWCFTSCARKLLDKPFTADAVAVADLCK